MAAVMESPEFRGEPLTADMMARRYHDGSVCLIAELGETIVYLSWIRFSDASMHRDGIEVPLRPGEAYIDSIFAMPAYRGQGLATAAAIARLKYLRQRGIRAAYGWVAPHNTPMIKLLARVGYQEVGRITQIVWRLGRRVPLVNLITVAEPADSLADTCSPRRLKLRSGVTVYRRRRSR
jgi:ribosomal protein S18 acetylase RimI-like enzyme